MSKKYIYLSGASKHREDEGKAWTQAAEQLLLPVIEHLDFFVPQIHFDYTFRKPPTEKACLTLFTSKIKECDIVLLNLNHTDKSVGSGYEIGYAKALGKVVIGFGNEEIYGWLSESCDYIGEDLEDAIQYILIHYL